MKIVIFHSYVSLPEGSSRLGVPLCAQLRKYKIAEIALGTSLRAARQQRVPLSAILQREEQVRGAMGSGGMGVIYTDLTIKYRICMYIYIIIYSLLLLSLLLLSFINILLLYLISYVIELQ